MLEVLTPAPGAEALIAAVQSGADAVCIRFGGAGARGFTQSEFARSVRYCRVRGCRVYAELDTLVADSEMSAAADFVRGACEGGVGAGIARDGGCLAAAKAVAPLLRAFAGERGIRLGQMWYEDLMLDELTVKEYEQYIVKVMVPVESKVINP